MIKLKDSYAKNPTYVVGHWFNNGCQTKPLDMLNKICENHKVPHHYIDELNDALENPDNVWGDSEDWDSVINHNDFNVRIMAVKQGCGLDVSINDEHEYVRAEVAHHGYGLDKLINDKDTKVRYGVVKQGYGLDILINDEDEDVRCVAIHILNKGKQND